MATFGHEVVIIEGHGDQPTLLPKRQWLLGETKTLKIVFVSQARADQTGATCTFKIYNSAGSLSATVTPTPTLSTNKTRMTCEKNIKAAAGGDITLADTYTVLVTYTLSTTVVRVVKFTLEVLAVP